jgi:drug/metabolite transporter (DMT)-like permease
MTEWLLVGIIVASNAFGDLLNTRGMRRHGEVRDLRPGAIPKLVGALARNRLVLGGIAALAVGFFTLLSLLSVADLSFAVPATAAGYVVETLLARWVLKERVGWQRWAGASLVACGVGLLAL